MSESLHFDYLIILLTCALTAAIVLVMIARSRHMSPNLARIDGSRDPRAAVFLFRDGVLVQANSAALQYCADGPLSAFDWPKLSEHVATRFPEFPSAQGSFLHRDFAVLHSSVPQDSSVITIDQWGGMARVTLIESDVSAHQTKGVASRAALEAPIPIWKTDSDDRLIWTNAAYDALANSLDHVQPLQITPLFDTGLLAPNDSQFRASATSLTQKEAQWFDIRVVRSPHSTTYYATDANAIVSAEIAQRNFVQTLAKTFAQLSIGLAIFDRDQRLALFNPALIELTGLPADFLSAQPGLSAFFDKLRDNRMMPEPKSYASWRDLINDLVLAATDGRYAETWTLPSGLTYRVSGRPHPDGAVAFLFEDISAEISLTRRFRAEIEQGHTVLDQINTGLALFSATGELLLCNRFYRDLWNTDPDSAFAEYTLHDALQVWQNDTRPSDVWQNFRDSPNNDNPRTAWAEIVLMHSGQPLNVTVTPVAGGTMLIQFELTPVPTLTPAVKPTKSLPA